MVRRYLTRKAAANGSGGTGLIGTSLALTLWSPCQASSSRCACTACPPRIRSEAATMATRKSRSMADSPLRGASFIRAMTYGCTWWHDYSFGCRATVLLVRAEDRAGSTALNHLVFRYFRLITKLMVVVPCLRLAA